MKCASCGLAKAECEFEVTSKDGMKKKGEAK